MKLSALLSADIRARASFLGYCPMCSVVGVRDFPDTLIGPRHRSITLRANHAREKDVTIFKLSACCAMSRTDQTFESEAEAASWWAEKRQQPVKDPALDSRRRNVLAKLAAASLEPIV